MKIKNTKIYSQQNFGQQMFVVFKLPTKMKCAENLIDQKMDNVKISRSTVCACLNVHNQILYFPQYSQINME